MADDWHSERREIQGSGGPNRPPTAYSQSWDPAWLERVSPTMLVKLLAPVLALVGAAGMNAADREEWMTAAAMMLEHLPEDLVRIGLKAATRKADHPSKVIPIALAEVEDLQRTRMRIVDNPRPLAADALPAPGQHRPTPAEAAAIMAEFGIASSNPKPPEPRELHNPTAADYVALGLTAEQAQEAVKTLLPTPRKRNDGQIGNHLPDMPT